MTDNLKIKNKLTDISDATLEQCIKNADDITPGDYGRENFIKAIPAGVLVIEASAGCNFPEESWISGKKAYFLGYSH